MLRCPPLCCATHPLLGLVAHALLQLVHVLVPLAELLLQSGNLCVGSAQLTLSLLHQVPAGHRDDCDDWQLPVSTSSPCTTSTGSVPHLILGLDLAGVLLEQGQLGVLGLNQAGELAVEHARLRQLALEVRNLQAQAAVRGAESVCGCGAGQSKGHRGTARMLAYPRRAHFGRHAHTCDGGAISRATTEAHMAPTDPTCSS